MSAGDVVQKDGAVSGSKIDPLLYVPDPNAEIQNIFAGSWLISRRTDFYVMCIHASGKDRSDRCYTHVNLSI